MSDVPAGGLKPLEQWICDHCREVIDGAKAGWLEWLHDEKTGAHSFRLVHHSVSSPRGLGRCYGHTDERNKQDNHLDQYVGPEGIAYTLDLLTPFPSDDYQEPLRADVRNINEYLDLFCRLHVPGYEEARRYFTDAEHDNGALAAHHRMVPSVLARIIRDYRGR